MTQGIIHLFRDKYTYTCVCQCPSNGLYFRVKSQDERSRISEVLCVLGVPAHVSLSDFLNFVSPSLYVL